MKGGHERVLRGKQVLEGLHLGRAGKGVAGDRADTNCDKC